MFVSTHFNLAALRLATRKTNGSFRGEEVGAVLYEIGAGPSPEASSEIVIFPGKATTLIAFTDHSVGFGERISPVTRERSDGWSEPACVLGKEVTGGKVWERTLYQ